MLYERDALLNDLRAKVIEVVFTKVNGDERTMRCTLKPDRLPAKYVEEAVGELAFHKENKEVIRAWDVQASGWRSFRIDSGSYVAEVQAH